MNIKDLGGVRNLRKLSQSCPKVVQADARSEFMVGERWRIMKKCKYHRGAMPKAEFLKLDTSAKKAEMVAWLMRRGQSLWAARQIVHRKFFHGDPFEREAGR